MVSSAVCLWYAHDIWFFLRMLIWETPCLAIPPSWSSSVLYQGLGASFGSTFSPSSSSSGTPNATSTSSTSSSSSSYLTVQSIRDPFPAFFWTRLEAYSPARMECDGCSLPLASVCSWSFQRLGDQILTRESLTSCSSWGGSTQKNDLLWTFLTISPDRIFFCSHWRLSLLFESFAFLFFFFCHLLKMDTELFLPLRSVCENETGPWVHRFNPIPWKIDWYIPLL